MRGSSPSASADASAAFGPKQVLLVFLLVLAGYLGIYGWIEHRRHAKGPWTLQFSSVPGGPLTMRIVQERLGIDSRLILSDETVPPPGISGSVTVEQPGMDLPVGRIIYEDLTFLPGVVTLDLLGHEVELMPRVLLVNKREIPWHGHEGPIELRTEDKPMKPPEPPDGGTRAGPKSQ